MIASVARSLATGLRVSQENRNQPLQPPPPPASAALSRGPAAPRPSPPAKTVGRGRSIDPSGSRDPKSQPKDPKPRCRETPRNRSSHLDMSFRLQSIRRSPGSEGHGQKTSYVKKISATRGRGSTKDRSYIALHICFFCFVRLARRFRTAVTDMTKRTFKSASSKALL